MANENVLNKFEHPDSTSPTPQDNALVLDGTVKGEKPAQTLLATVTLAEINAGKTILAGVAGLTIKVTDFKATVSGTFGATTSVEVEDTDGSPVAIASTAVAGLTDGTILNEVQTNTTMGAGYLGALTTGEGIAVTKTGADATGGTSITYRILYTLV